VAYKDGLRKNSKVPNLSAMWVGNHFLAALNTLDSTNTGVVTPIIRKLMMRHVK
jgi:hypothetical protein